jgi:hypothetical protein
MRRTVIIGIAAIGSVVVGLLAFRSWITASPRPVGIDEAVDRYRQSTSTTLPGDEALAMPAAGVYVYNTSGDESVDALGGDSHSYPAVTAMAVAPEACGYRLTWTPLDGRTDSWLLCVQGSGVALTASTTEHEFFRQSDREEFVCDPGAWWLPPAGITAWTATCRTPDRVSTRAGRVVATELVDVGGVSQPAVHVRFDDVLSAGSTGTSTSDFWLDPRTGLVLRQRSDAHTSNESVLGRVAFHEEIELLLRAVDPRT